MITATIRITYETLNSIKEYVGVFRGESVSETLNNARDFASKYFRPSRIVSLAVESTST